MLHNDHEVINYFNKCKVMGTLFNRINKRVNLKQDNNRKGSFADVMDNSRYIAGNLAARTNFQYSRRNHSYPPGNRDHLDCI